MSTYLVWKLNTGSRWAVLACAALMMLSARGRAQEVAAGQGTRVVRLSEMLPLDGRQGFGELGINETVTGKPLSVGERKFEHGLGTHAACEYLFDLAGDYERFQAWVGVDAIMIPHKMGSVEFVAYGDGRELFRSGIMRQTDPAKRVDVSVAGVQELKLVVGDGGDGINGDNADWGEAVLVGKPEVTEETPRPAKFTVKSPTVSVGLNEDGQIAAVRTGLVDQGLRGWTRLAGCRIEGKTEVKELPGGGMVFTRKLKSLRGGACTVAERLMPTDSSVRWEVEITGQGETWTAPIISALSCERPAETRFWTAWSDPLRKRGPWRDPLVMTPLPTASWYYGNVTSASPVSGDFISVPLVTLASAKQDAGLSLVLSPEDPLLDMQLMASAGQQVQFVRTRYRIAADRTLHFAMDITGHEGDWRGGLRWMAGRYPAYFDPPNPRVHEMAGCGAYSGDENPIDVAKFKKMGFRINWKLSDDFAYMGMFIPPVKNAEERWTRSCDEVAPPNKTETTSCKQQNDYAKYMRANGFYLLNYFNVTEFGKNMKDRDVSAVPANDPELWKDPVAFVKLKLPGARLQPLIPTYYGAWVVDIGDPGFRDFMLEQARRHIELIPDSDGICVDRMDWLRYYNRNADDGVSWVAGKPARSLYRGWMEFTAALGPMMHQADKVIFGNTMTMRLELSRELDGIYSEHGDHGSALNGSAFMGIRKPVLAWTSNQRLKEPDPDSFFQRHLHMGAYPTAPYPGNHHCTVPDAWTESEYMTYGPLMDAMRGKKWVLSPHCVETSTPGVKVNLFEVPGGYALPVTFGHQTELAVVKLHGVEGLEGAKCVALHPGEAGEVAVAATLKDGELELHVPLKRGCAMVRVRK